MKVLQINEIQHVAGGELAFANHDCLEYAKSLRIILNDTIPNAADDYYKAYELAIQTDPNMFPTAPCDRAELKAAFAGLDIKDKVNNIIG